MLLYVNLVFLWLAFFNLISFCQSDSDDCSSALGVANGKQPGTKLSASSTAALFINHLRHQRMIANYGRLNGRFSWCARKPRGSWLMVEFDNVTTVTGIATQGFRTIYNHYYVQKYKVQYSSSNSDWKYATKRGTIMTFPGNANGFDTARNDFDAVQAKRIKIIPVKFKYRVCMKVELYGCIKGQSWSQTTTTTKPSSTKMIFSTKSISTTSPLPTMRTNPTKSSPRSTPKSSPRSTPKSSPVITTEESNASIENTTNSVHQSKSGKLREASHQPFSVNDQVILGVTVIVVLIVFITIPVAIYLILRQKRRKFKPTQHYGLHSLDGLLLLTQSAALRSIGPNNYSQDVCIA